MNAQEFFRRLPHREHGDEIQIHCPFCVDVSGRPDTGYHLYVNTKKGKWICFRCGNQGNAQWLIKKLDFQAQIEFEKSEQPFNLQELLLRSLYGEIKEDKVKTQAMKYPHWAVKIHAKDAAWKYLKGRGITIDNILTYKLRRSQDGQFIFVPFYEDGMFVYWQARAIHGKEKLNPSNAEGTLGKSYYLFGHDQAKNRETIVVCEGWADAITIGMNAVSIQGKTISDVQTEKLLKLKPNRVVVMLDFDDETEHQAKQIAQKIYDRSMGAVSVGIVNGFGKTDLDPNDMGHEMAWKYINELTVYLQQATLFSVI